MSAAESNGADQAFAVRFARFCADVVEIAARRGCAQQLDRVARALGLPLPPFGRLEAAAGRLVLSVRPDRWLILNTPENPGACAAGWQSACAGIGAAVDQSSALTAFHVSGRAVRDVMARSCRLDLDPQRFAAGCAAATIMAQVSVIIAALPSGIVILSASTTARHFREWFVSTAHPFGLGPQADVAWPEVLRSGFP